MHLRKVLITDDCHPLLTEGLQQLGYQCDFCPDITPEETLERISAYEGLVINSKIIVHQTLLDAATRLRFVARLGSGMEIVDKAYAAQKQVAVYGSPEGNRNAVAEHALGMLLALANNLVRADREVRNFNWRREANRGWELSGKTLGIIGFGHTGSQFAQKLAGLDIEVLAYDKYKCDFAADFPWVSEVSFEDIIKKSDIISFHLPLTAETKHIADRSFFEACKPGVIIVNTSRGQCVKTDDLIAALTDGTVGGACLDVFENEKTATFSEKERVMYARLYSFDQVVLSPHIAGWTRESKRKLAEILLEKIKSAQAL